MDTGVITGATDAATAQVSAGDVSAAKSVAAKYAQMTEKAANYDQRLREVSQEFTSILFGQMFNLMAEGLDTEGVGFGGTPEKFFREMAYEEYAKEIVKSQDLGLAEVVYKSLAGRNGARSAYAGSREVGNVGQTE